MKKIFIILISLLISSTVFSAIDNVTEKVIPLESPLDKLFKYFKNGEMIKIQSYNAKNYMEIKDGSYKNSPQEIDAFIAYPKKDEGPFPVLIFAHTSGGPLLFTNKSFKFNRLVAKSLSKKGIAVMFLDNFAARGAYRSYGSQKKCLIGQRGLMHLKHLNIYPKIQK